MKLKRIVPLAALGIVGASLSPAAPHGERAALIEGTWNLELLREGCDDLTASHPGERWTFGADGAFERVRMRADGTFSHEAGRYVFQHGESELNLILGTSGGGRRVEAFPILSLDETRLELLSPTEVRQGVVIKQERFAAFFHS